MKFSIYRSWDEVDDPAFISQWREWVDRSTDAHVFNHPSMVRVWTDTYRTLQEISPYYCVATTESGSTIFLPLVIWRRNWKNGFLRMLVPAGLRDYDYHDPLVAGEVSAAESGEFWKRIREIEAGCGTRLFDEILLPCVRNQEHSDTWVPDEAICPYKDLRPYADFDEFFAGLGAKTRNTQRRQMRLLEALGRVEFHVFQRDENELALRSFPAFLDAHSQRWKNSYRTPGLHENIMRELFDTGIVHFSEIRIDSRPVSWEIGFRYKSKAYRYLGAFLEDYSKYSMANMHLVYLIKDCFSHGIDIFDHLRGGFSYKSSWSDGAVPLYKYSRQCTHPSARMRLGAYRLLMQIKAFQSR
jgi:CelD/BcsL family acetyltransferase involved in cellulose biosynthesis